MSRFEQSKEVFNKLFGELPTNEKDPELMEILRRSIFGDVFHSGELDIKTRELITVTTLACMQTLPQLKAHLFGAMNAGATPIELREVLYQLAPFIGFPRTLNAIGILNEVLESKGITLPLENKATTTEETRYNKGLEIQEPLYGNEIKENFKEVPFVAKFLTEFCFGDFYTRKGLELKTRELLILVALTTLTQTNAIKPHILANIKLGNTKETLYSAMIQCMPYIGLRPCMDAINLIKQIQD